METTGHNDVVFRSKSPGPGEYQNLLLHSGVLINTSAQPTQGRRSQRAGGASVKSSDVEHRIVSNLRYSLEMYKLGSDKELYSKLVDCLVVGPATLKLQDLSQALGINQEILERSRQNRLSLIQSGAQPSWTERRTGGMRSRSVPREGRSEVVRRGSSSNSYLRSPLERRFDEFSRFGGCEGRMITLTESDKWLRQGKLLDNWNVTTRDTGLAFRKISRGSVWLDYKKWRQFLDELVEKKELDMNNVIERLENCRIPSMTDRITSANPRLLLS